MTVAEHAKLFSASAADRWMLCPGSAVLTAGVERTSTEYSVVGTVIHEMAAAALDNDAAWPVMGSTVVEDGHSIHSIKWDADMQECAEEYVAYVRSLPADFLYVEQRVRFAEYLGIDDPEDGFGTADAIVGIGDELVVIDLKTGRGVKVDATDNRQLKLYALGALALLQGVAGEFTKVRLVIVQPRAGGVSEWVCSVADLEAWGYGEARSAATSVMNAVLVRPDEYGPTDWRNVFLSPSDKACRWCAAKATCPALRDEVADMVGLTPTPATPEEFENMVVLTDSMKSQAFDAASAKVEAQWISAALSKVDLIEDWCKAVRAEAERRLLNGEPVPGYKVVAGKKGARSWADEAQAEEVLRKQMRLTIEEAYNLKLITPPQAEKLHKAGKIGPRQWPKLQALITQSEGKPHVAPESDPRPALSVGQTAQEFDNLADVA